MTTTPNDTAHTGEGRPKSKRRKVTPFEQDVLRSAEQNHIWLNAFHCIRPSVEFRLQLADRILSMLNDKGLLIHDNQDHEIEAMREIGRLTPQLVLRINKS